MKERDFDCYQRYTALRNLLDGAYPETADTAAVSVLDVGSGNTTLSRDFLGPRYKVTRSDVDVDATEAADLVPLQRGQPLPFQSREFDAVIAMDVLEHVPSAERALFVRECMRVARDVCILAAPADAREVEDAEARVYAEHQSRLGSHAYFEEHLTYGLPTARDIEQWIAAEQAELVTLPNVPLLAWETFSCLDFLGYSNPQTCDLTMDAHLIENSAFPAICRDGAHYRTFYIACRTPELHARVQQRVDEMRSAAAPLAAETPLALAWGVIAASCTEARKARSYAHELEIQSAQTAAQLAAMRAELDKVVREKQQVEADLRQQLQEQLQRLREHQATISAILSSRSWRYLEPIRKAAEAWRRARGKWRAQG